MSDVDPEDMGVEALPGPSGPVPLSEIREIQLIARGAKPHPCVRCGAEIARGEAALVVNERGAYRPWRLCEECAPARVAGAEVLWGRSATWRGPTDHSVAGHNPGGWERIPISREEAARIEERQAEQERMDRKEREELWRRQDAERDAEVAEQVAAAEVARDSALTLLAEMCELAGMYAADAERPWPLFEHVAEGLARQAADLLCPTRAGDEWYAPPPGSPDAEVITFIATYVCKLTAQATAQRLGPGGAGGGSGPV